MLLYKPETGSFFRLTKPAPSARVGDLAGCDNGNGYLRITLDGASHYSHRLAWLYITGEWPKDQIDHINHIRDDNRWGNIREVTHQENQMNRSISPNNTSGVTGVHWDKCARKWRAKIKREGKTINIGLFDCRLEAAKERLAAEMDHGLYKKHGMEDKEQRRNVKR